MALTPEELALMTTEEREGFEEGDDEPELDEDGNPIEEEEEEADEAAAAAAKAATDAAAAGRDDGAEPDAAAVAAAAAATAEAEKAKNEPIEPPRAQPVPLIRAELPADMEAKRATIETGRDELAQKFEDGDLTAREFQAQNRLLDKQENDLDWLVRKSELSAETTKAQAEATWYASTEVFLKAHPEIMKNELVYNAFDAVVRQVTADKANHGLSDVKQLEKAHAIWAESLGIVITPPAKDAPPKKLGKRDLPPSLATVPAAEQSETDDGKYAGLDRLMETDPIAYEAALAKMTPAESDAYLSSN